MNYEIKGTPMPVLVCTLEQGEQMLTEGGGMSWMSENIDMTTTTNGGLKKALGRMLSRDKMFQNIYTANSKGFIAFASSFMGDIMPIEVKPGEEYICQKSSFLASTRGVNMEMFFRKKLSTGLFGGEGFIMQKFSGSGLLFIEIDGSAMKYTLGAGEKMIIDTGHLVMMSSTCSMDIKKITGAKNIFFGGEGLFNTVVTGPGEIILQTLPISNLAAAVSEYIPSSGGSVSISD